MPPNSRNSRLKSLNHKINNSKRNYTFLKFPLDVDMEGTQNMLLININAESGSKYINSRYRVVEGETAVVEQRGSTSLNRHMGGSTSRIDTAIVLYMPPQIQTSYQNNWAASELGTVGAIIDAWNGMGDMTKLSTWKDAWARTKEAAPEVLKSTLAKVADAVTPFNVKDGYALVSRKIENPYMEVLFKGVNNRTFTFTFKFIPKSKSEQEGVQKIIKTLKFHAAPEKKLGGSNLFWSFPSTFDLSFIKKDGQANEWLYKISTCALTDISVQQGGDNTFSSHEDGSPFATTMTLSFTEMELMTKERIDQGF